MKGSEILPDYNTLEEHGITERETVSVLIEPEHDIVVEVQCGPMQYRHNVSHNMTLKQLKMLLIENNQVAFLYKEFDLVTCVTYKGIKQEQMLDDENLPLHYFSLEKQVNLAVVGPYVFLKAENPFGKTSYHKISKHSTVSELKAMIVKSACHEDVTDISMFVTCENDCYEKLDETDSAPVWKLLSKDKRVNFIEDKLSFSKCWSVYSQGKEIGEVFTLCDDDESEYETALSMKLRFQEQMGVPANCVNVGEKDCGELIVIENNENVTSETYIEIKSGGASGSI